MIARLALALLALLLLLPAPALAVTTKFMESGGDATSGTEFYDSVSGATTATDQSHTGPRSLKATYSGTTPKTVKKNGILADAGRSITMWIRLSEVSVNTPTVIFRVQTSGGTAIASFGFGASLFQPNIDAASNCGSAMAAVSANTWYRIRLSYVITSASSYTFVFVDGTGATTTLTRADCGVDLSTTGTADLLIGAVNPGSSASGSFWIDDVYVDDRTDLADPGAIRVTAKLPISNNTGNLTDSFGVAAPASRYTNVDDRPLDATTGWINTNTTANAENYGIQAASAGDVDTTGATYIARAAWVRSAKLDQSGATTLGTGIGSCTVTANGNTGCTTGSMNFMTGQTVLCGLAENTAGASEAISDTLSNTWTALTGGSSTVKLSAWYAVIGAGTKAGAATVSFSATAGNIKRAGACVVLDGNDASTPLDKNPAATTDGTSTYNSAATGTLTQANETVAAVFAFAGPNSDTTACASPTGSDSGLGLIGTNTGGATSNASLRICYGVVAATTTVTPAATNSTSNRAGVQTVATLKIRNNATPGAGTPKITNNGSDTAITLTTTPTTYTNIVDSSSYPSNAAAIGMVASGATASTVFYEGGMLIAYIPGTPSCTGSRARTGANGAGRCSRQMTEAEPGEPVIAAYEESDR